MEKKDKELRQDMTQRGVVLATTLGVIFDPAKRKILIGKRVHDPYIKNKWCFPGARLEYGEDLERSLEAVVKKKTGLEVKSLGSVFSKILEEDKKFLLMYFLCEAVGGEERPSEEFSELKWVDPDEIESHFSDSFDSRLKEYILGLK